MISENEQIEQSTYIKDSLCDAFKNRDPSRFHSTITKLISSVPKTYKAHSKNTVSFIRYLMAAFHWKFLPYSSSLVSQICGFDPSNLSPPKTLAHIIHPSQVLVMHKNWHVTSKLFVHYLVLVQKVTPNVEDPAVTHIYQVLDKALQDLKQVENSGDGELLLNNCLMSIIDFYREIVTNHDVESLDRRFIQLALEISFLCIQKSVQKVTIEAATKVVENIISKVKIGRLNIDAKISDDFMRIKDYIMTYSKDENWRVRENILYILEGLNSLAIRHNEYDYLDFEELVPFFKDDNIYVNKMARLCLKTILKAKPHKIPEVVEKYKSISKNHMDTLKTLKSKKEDTKEEAHALSCCINVLLSCCYACGYSIPEYLPPLILFLYNLIPIVPNTRTDIFEFISGFKKIHQQLVHYQPQRFSEEELDELKEIFNINSSTSMTY